MKNDMHKKMMNKALHDNKAKKNDTYNLVVNSEQLNFIEYLISNYIDEQFEGLGDEIKSLTNIETSEDMPDWRVLEYHGDNLKKLSIGILCLYKVKDTLENMKNEK